MVLWLPRRLPSVIFIGVAGGDACLGAPLVQLLAERQQD